MIGSKERFIWATDLLQINPTDQILEIGCGAGLWAEQICCQLTSGKFVAVDKSAPILAKAKKRNAAYITQGTAEFVTGTFADCTWPASFFSAVVAFNVNFFLKNSAFELALIKQILKPQGKLFVFYQAPYEIDISATEPVKNILIQNAFNILAVQIKKLQPTSAFCIIAQPLNND